MSAWIGGEGWKQLTMPAAAQEGSAVKEIFGKPLNYGRIDLLSGKMRKEGMKMQGLDFCSGSHLILKDTSRVKNPKCPFSFSLFSCQNRGKVARPGAAPGMPGISSEHCQSRLCPLPVCEPGLQSSCHSNLTN